LTVTVVTGTGCLQGKTETYVFQVLSPCSSGGPKLFVDNGNNGALIGSVQAFPNPANAFTVIQLPNEWELEKTKIQIIDLFGREVKQIVVNGHFLNLDVSAFASGIYSIQIINNSEKQSVKLIINH